MLNDEYLFEVVKLLMEVYEQYGEKAFNQCISMTYQCIAKDSYDKYAYTTFSYCYIDGQRANLEQLEAHRNYNNEKYGDYHLHDMLNLFRRNAQPYDWDDKGDRK